MKKLLTTLSFLGLLATGTVSAYAGNLYYPTYTQASARASYTIGCTTYYYNPYTGQSLGSEQIYTGTCGYSTYYQTQYQYVYPSYTYSYSYPAYQSTYQYVAPASTYYTYGYSNGSWYPGYSSGILNSLSNGFTNTYYNSPSQGCYYQNGYQVCY